jgi:hypothetical protein
MACGAVLGALPVKREVKGVRMLLALVALGLVAVCLVLRELVRVRRELSSIRQFLEWSAVGLLERTDLSPSRREYVEKVKQDLARESNLSRRQVEDLRS